MRSRVVRRAGLRSPTLDDRRVMQRIVGSRHVFTEDLEAYNHDWMNKFKGTSPLVVQPHTTDEVSQVLRHCSTTQLPLVPQGGNTGLVGGSTPIFDELVLNLKRMNNIISFDPLSGVLVCDAGCILQHLDTYLADYGYMMPLDLGAKGSCQIGGNVSTNAGGLRLVRYGSLHGSVLGLEVVLASGETLDLMSTLRKDNTGYDLKQLFIGAEGTLGVVTKVAILAVPKPAHTSVLYFAVDTYAQVLKVLCRAKSSLSGLVSAIEFMDGASLDLVFQQGTLDPLSSKHSFYVLIETSSQVEEEERTNAFIEDVMEQGYVVDGTVAQDETQLQQLWRIREACPEAVVRAGTVFKYDVSVPVETMYEVVEEMRMRLHTELGLGPEHVIGYGHLGDSNLHLNIWTPESVSNEEAGAAIEPYVFELVRQRSGSISAEHGLGSTKNDLIHYSKPHNVVNIMHDLKRMFDPQGVLNPYKVLPNTRGDAE